MTENIEVDAKVNSLVEVIKKAENDNQKCAALLVVSKMVKADELSANQRKRIFLAIGVDFPLRLLTNNESEESKSFLISLGLSLLSSFVTDKDLLETPKLFKAIPMVINLLDEKYKPNVASEDQVFLLDCFQFLSVLATTKQGCEVMLQHSAVRSLVNLLSSINTEQISSLLWTILLNLISFDEESVWESSVINMSQLLDFLADSICNNQSSEKFTQLKQLYFLLMKLPKRYSKLYFHQSWIDNVRESLYDILRSRINSSQRNPALKLSSCLTEIFGLKWTLCHSEANSKEKQLLTLLTQLSCVEIKMIIYEWTEHNSTALQEVQGSEEISLLLSCFIVFEAVCAEIAQFDCGDDSTEILSFKEIEELKSTLSDTAKVITETVLVPLQETAEGNDLMLCCLRAVGSWLNVEIYATSEVGLGLSEAFIRTFKSCVKVEPVEAIKSATPAILHYAENSNSLAKALDLDLACVLCDLLTNTELTTETKSLAAQSLMALCLGADNSQWFTDILPKLMENAIKSDIVDMVSWFYIATLVLLIWNKQDETLHNSEHSKRFFKNLTNVFHQMHKTNKNHIEVNKRYRDIWEDVEQLWSIAVKEFIRAAQKCGYVAAILMESSLPRRVETLLSSCNETNEVVECYGLLNACVETLKQR